VKRGGATALLFAMLAAILGVLLLRMQGPAPLPETAPPSSFSAARAIAFEREILGGDVPHPVGSPAHDAVRERLAARFRALGYDVTVQRSFACSPFVTCAPVANVIARVPGDTRPDALVLAAHYDSVPAGPGVSDDGVGMAALVETARALRNERFRNPIVYLVTDAEEVALLGAEGFVADPVMLHGSAAVINVEARGTDGPSFLFETSRQNAWLARVIARSLPRPATSSLYYDIYELLPNDTDLTVFKRAGLAGVGFGHIGRPIHYHTPLDNFANLTPSTVQHHGDHILALARALAATDLRQTSSGNAVWFDVLSFFVVSWPQYLSLGIAIAGFVILIVGAFNRKTRPRAITIGVASFFLTLISALLVGFLGNWLDGLRSSGAVWVAHPGPAIAAAWFIGAGIAVFVAQRLVAFAGIDGLFLGRAICWSAIAVALSIVLPGGSYLAIVPAVVCAVCAVLKLSDGVAAIICAVAAAIVLFPLGVALYDALGRPILPFVAVLIALVATTFAPFLAGIDGLRRPLNASVAAAAIACIAMALIVPANEANSPRHINLEYVDDGATPRWQTDRLSPAIQRAAQFNPTPQVVYDWTVPPARALIAPAPALGLTPAELRVVNDERHGGRHLTLQLRSTRNAPRIALIFRAPSFAALRVNGIAPPPMTRPRGGLAPGWHRVSIRGASEATIEIDLTRDEAIDAVVIDGSYGLPATGTALAQARDASLAIPVQEGDLTTTLRRIRL
jgi:Peptidase family M28